MLYTNTVYIMNIALPLTIKILNPFFFMASYLNHLTLLQTIFFLFLLFTVRCTQSSLSHDEECSALLHFKQSMFNQDDAVCAARAFQTFRSWKPPSNASDADFDCCFWDRVICSNDKYGHVIGLDLSESYLCGYINSTTTLFSLVHLRTLNLAVNDFYESQIPFEIARLKQLSSLNLSNSGFSGQIPNEISQLMKLSSLDLSRNPLKLHNPSLKNLLQNLTRLEELHLSGVDISSSVPHFLANFSSLRSIVLYNCSLQDEFPATIFELPKLKILDVAYNTKLTGSFPEFRNCSNQLTLLALTGCSFSGHIPNSLSNLTQLAYLGLASNKFTGFVPVLVSLLKLKVLELDGNKFEKGRVPNWLGKLTEISELYLSNMNIHSEIPPFLPNLTKLSVVGMKENFLVGHIPSSFFNITNLKMLYLERNQLQGPISSSFSNFKSLQDLRLQYNHFNGRVDLDTFLGLKNLKDLVLGYNRISLEATNHTNSTIPKLEYLDLTSCKLEEFPTFLRFQNKMRVLFLGHNKIIGPVPVWIWNNSQETLQVIDLSNNYITGFHQHPHFLPWRCLEGLFISNNQVRGQLPIPPQTTVVYDFGNNKLTGEIPPFLCEAKSLRMLDLSSNNMSGTLPPCFASSSNSLLVLNLRRNNFHGTMMNVCLQESLLESIDLSENKFVGQLPRSLTNCTNLEVLSLGDNSFNDVFPFWLETIANLQVLILRSNKFYGPIQGSKFVSSQFPKLRIIDLSNNCFSGQLHQKYFQTWNAMKSIYYGESSLMESEMSFELFMSTAPYTMTIIHKGVRTEYEHILTIFTAIDLSCNHFEGEIPQSLKDLRGLESLNLSNNHFTGRILPTLGYLKNLESLDLSQNELSGEIPQQLVQLAFLAILNVSFNRLDGCIPLGKQFNTFLKDSYKGNPGLRGKPLSKECQDLKSPRLQPASNKLSESLIPSGRIDWIIISSGIGSGLAIGIFIGNFLHTRNLKTSVSVCAEDFEQSSAPNHRSRQLTQHHSFTFTYTQST